MADFASASTGSSGASPPGTSKTPWWCLPYPTKRKPSSFSFTPTNARGHGHDSQRGDRQVSLAPATLTSLP